jgi:hypothetical protein
VNLLFLDLLEEFRHPENVSLSGHLLELDFFYPKLNIAVEFQVQFISKFLIFQGKQHYKNVAMFHGNSLEEGKQRDLTKKEWCKEKGIHSYIFC